ncbi:uncharacterized protein LOC116189446 isoform X2 [Punica granatum]|nr:uncharacterized protein LOC116189446 isoform X2 [Punica granatum]
MVHVPQTLVSTTWSIEGPSATAAYPDELVREESRCVLVFQNDGRHGYFKAELRHPQPVVSIQWRPSTGRRLKRSLRTRHLLLTCCLDGAVRLWAEIDHGRHKRVKDVKDSKASQCSFCVVALIDKSNGLNATLDASLSVMWAIEVGGFINLVEEASHLFFADHNEHEQVGQCEWLVGFGPELKITFWAIHCIDEFSPLRYPRVTLWKTKDLQDRKLQHIQSVHSKAVDGSLVKKVVISRNSSTGPPFLCSFLHFSSCSSLSLSLFYNQKEHHKQEDLPFNTPREENFLSCLSSGVLSTDGHSGKILQVVVHPYYYEGGLAVSLDSNGLLLFWLFSTISSLSHSVPTLIPMLRLFAKMMTQENGPKYTSLRWAPSILDDDRILLLVHVDGIDCLVIRMSKGEALKLEFQRLCTIPYTGSFPVEDGPTDIYSIPLPSTCKKTFKPDNFMLLGVWKKGFYAGSWVITVHSYDLSETPCGCSCESDYTDNSKIQKFESVFSGRRYCISVCPCSSEFPYPHSHDLVTNYSIVCPDGFFPFIQQDDWIPINDQCGNYYPYVMATGCADGNVKLWRTGGVLPSSVTWELVGAFGAQQGPISKICLADCGQKIASVCAASGSDSSETLYIWEPMNIAGTGCFVLEHTLSLTAGTVAMKWLTLGNGKQILGVCMQEKLQIYAQRPSGGQNSAKTKPSNMQIWSCIAEAHLSSPVFDFFWGPAATAVVVHSDYIYSFGQWLLNKHHNSFHAMSEKNLCIEGSTEGGTMYFTDPNICKMNGLSVEGSGMPFISRTTLLPGIKHNHEANCTVSERAERNHAMFTTVGSHTMLNVVDELCESIPVYHPEALCFNIYLGNWRRAYIALQHLVQHLSDAPGKRYTHSDCGNTIPQIVLLSYLKGAPQEGSTNKGFQWDGGALSINSSLQFQVGSIKSASEMWSYGSSNVFASSSSSTNEFSGLAESLEKYAGAAAISDKERREILAANDLLNEISNSQSSSVYEGLDEPGKRFWVGLRYQQVQFFHEFGRKPSVEELAIDSASVCWAFHSDCQESLLSSFLPIESSWKELQVMGVGLWFNNVTQLRARMEKLARLQYLKKKDPKDCALLYVALNRLQVLAGLFKISRNEKDKPLVGFLSRNFQEEKNKAAALKNAYVLLGRHQWELAIAFFLLGGDTSSAINICSKNLGDEQLALVLCRLVEGGGGPLERHLITKLMLPSAIEKDDYWLASLLEWQLGNYSQSFFCMLGLQNYSSIDESMLLSSHAAFSDPIIGLYCRLLATKNCLRNTVGERNVAVLGRWATLVMATALRRRGLHIEALECLCSSSFVGGSNNWNSMGNEHLEVLPGILEPSPSNSTNWLSADAAVHLETYTKFDLAIHHFSRLVRQHPYWPNANIATTERNSFHNDSRIHELEKLREHFFSKLWSDLDVTEQKFQLHVAPLLGKILLLPCNYGAPSIGYDLLQGYKCHEKSPRTIEALDRLNFYPLLSKLSSTLSDEVSNLFSRLAAACGITCSQVASPCNVNGEPSGMGSRWLFEGGNHIHDLTLLLRNLRAAQEIFSGSWGEDTVMVPEVNDLLEFCARFASIWYQRNSEALILMLQPILVSFSDGHIPYEVEMVDLKNASSQTSDRVAHESDANVDGRNPSSSIITSVKHENGGNRGSLIPEDEKWQILGVSLWKHMLRFTTHKLKMIRDKIDEQHISSSSLGGPSLCSGSAACSGIDGKNVIEEIKLLSSRMAQLLVTTLAHVSSYQVKQLVVLLDQKIDDGWPAMTLAWLEPGYSPHGFLKEHPPEGDITSSLSNINDEISSFHKLWDSWADQKMVSESFTEEKINLLEYVNKRPSRGWKEIDKSIMVEEIEGLDNNDGRSISGSGSNEVGTPSRGSWQKGLATSKEITPFQCPKEICKKNGELLEALCINSIDRQQIAVSSHRKGIVFLNWEDSTFKEETKSIWSEADWPPNGWAGPESTPVPTCVSPGIGLGSKKGAHLGLGGATVGTGSLATPGRDLTGGGAFGIPGYAGVGASGLGWEVQQDFEELVEHPATLETIRTRALSSHPSMPYFLAGSSNTLIYLWEFGKERAIATYGVLPSANVPPPYSLASVSAVQFGPCGHRFATAALDGTICTWQLEVGGRRNIHPTESSLCFNSHAMDVTYVTSSGSIIVAAGYSSNNVNVVIWDTLAPPSTSRASIICHEGGARSVSVFDSDIGNSSVSPLILTGGKGGDVGLHDFRYIATGKSKRLRHPDHVEHSSNSSLGTAGPSGNGTKHGIENVDGMLWYLPKAHLGSVTKIAKIPHTSLFLTGSKDGDVKLWDVKNAKLVHHWPKLHDRHTFLQPSTRGFGGVVRAGVTDVKVVSQGFISCGGDGTVKLVQLSDYTHGM